MAAVSRVAGAPPELLEPYQREALGRGIEEYRASMGHSLDFASAGMNLGNLESSLGNPDRAEEYYRTALAVDDLFFPAKMNLAVLLSAQGRNVEAETLLREVLQHYPDNADAAYSLGLLLVEMGQVDEAWIWLTSERQRRCRAAHACTTTSACCFNGRDGPKRRGAAFAARWSSSRTSSIPCTPTPTT